MRFTCLFLLMVFAECVNAADPLRIFVKGGAKTHGEGVHEHPRILSEFMPLLQKRGAEVQGGMEWPSADQLARTDVLVVYAQDGGDALPEEQERINTFVRAGGGVVVIHTALVSKQWEWWKTITGGAWIEGRAKWREGATDLYFIENQYVTDAHPITHGVSNFRMDDEMYYDLDLAPDIRVLAVAFTPKMPGGRMAPGGVPHIHDSQPQIWVREKILEGGEKPFRCVVSLPGHAWKTMESPPYRALLLRSIAWAGKLENVDAFCSAEEKAAWMYPEGGPRRPQATLAATEVHPEFDLSLVAVEPLINKPICLDWDATGRMWVAETPEYPNGRRGMRPDYAGHEWMDRGGIDPTPGEQDRKGYDRISILSDTNGDGVMDHKEIFHDGLELVTGFVFYRDGVIVTQAPDILWLRDTDGDGRADRVETLYTGLGTFDTHAVINNPRWGWDGWIYATHGYSASRKVKGQDGREISIGSGVVRFKPDGSAMEQYTSKGGNTWGLTITGDNRVMWSQPTSGDLLMQTLLPESALARIDAKAPPGYKVVESSIPVNPLIKWEELAYVQIDYVGRFTAAAGAAIYDGGAWPEAYTGDFFTAEPTVNLVHHTRLTPEGSSYKAARLPGFEKTEFIRSGDMWWRPIEVRVGADGALYILDFYSQAVIHNDTRGPPHNRVNAAVRPDRDHYFGRIWRVQHRQAKNNPIPNLSHNDTGTLVAALSHPNRVIRMLAHRRILEEKLDADSIVPLLASPLADVRIAASWTLQGLGALSDEEVERMFKDPDAAVRRNAATICAERPGAVPISLVTLLQDREPSVCLAALLAMQRENLEENAVDAVVRAWKDLRDDFERGAALGVTRLNALKILHAALPPDREADALVRAAVRGIVRQGRVEPMSNVLSVLAERETWTETQLAPVLDILASAKAHPPAEGEALKAVQKLLASPAAGSVLGLVLAWGWGDAFQGAIQHYAGDLEKKLEDSTASTEERFHAAEGLLRLRNWNPTLLWSIAKQLTRFPPETSSRLVHLLGKTQDGPIGNILTSQYMQLAPGARAAAFDVLLSRSEWAQVLLDELVQNKIGISELDPISQHRLRTHPDMAIAQRANAWLDEARGPLLAEKEKQINALVPEMMKPADIENGKQLFSAACGICHPVNGVGTAIGPALDGMGTHAPSELLTHIMDPNREVDPSFSTWNITTRSGQIHAGVIVRENPSMLVLRSLAGEEEIPVSEIVTRVNTGRSLMPEGLEALGSAGLRDILAFLSAGADTRFRTLDLRRAFTASTARGLYNKNDAHKSLDLIRSGTFTFGGIPFNVVTPEKSPNGLNVINLKGGGRETFSFKEMPGVVEVEGGGFLANRLHFLGGIGGWAYPFHSDIFPVLSVEVHFADGTSEKFIFRNGVEFADHIARREVPGSSYAEGVSRGFQVRWHGVAFQKAGEIKRIVLQSLDVRVAPTLLAITAELADAEAPPVPGMKAPSASAQWGAGTKVLLVGGGTSHDFSAFFDRTDRAILEEAGGCSVRYTASIPQAAAMLPEADVLVLSSNQAEMDSPAFRAALTQHLAAGRGVLFLHAATWYNLPQWPEYNREWIGGGVRSHDRLREFRVRHKAPGHPLLKNVPPEFSLVDELYHVSLDPATGVEILAETEEAEQTKKMHPALWIVPHPHARIVCLTLGHDARAHDHPAFRQILLNAVQWLREKND